MSTTTPASNVTAPTQFVQTKTETYAYRRFGSATGLPLGATDAHALPSTSSSIGRSAGSQQEEA